MFSFQTRWVKWRREFHQIVDADVFAIHVKAGVNLAGARDPHAVEQLQGYPLVEQARVLRIGLEFERRQTEEGLCLSRVVEADVQARLDRAAAAVAAVVHHEIAYRSGEVAGALPLKGIDVEIRVVQVVRP